MSTLARFKKMKVRMLFIVLGGCAALPPSVNAQVCPRTGWESGEWSRLAVQPCRENLDQNPLRVPLRGGKRSLLFDGSSVYIIEGRTSRKLATYHPGDELLGSPDSNHFLISYCFGATGPCGTESLDEEYGGPSITDQVREEFSAGHKGDACYAEANVGPLTWEQGSERVVVVAEVPPALECDGHNDGYFEAFVVSLPDGKIVSRFNMQETIRRWRSILGPGLRDDIKLVQEDARSGHK